MTWEETIRYIRTIPHYAELVEKAYFDEDLVLNVERFRNSEEYRETLELVRKYAPKSHSILDIGSGNGISSIAFALDGFQVTVSEPDPSTTVGAGAIRTLAKHFDLNNIEVYEEFAENINFSDKLFDVVYVRQALHHAYDLKMFVKNLASLLKPVGLLLTIRDHVIFNEEDKNRFLQCHPLQQYYGGENAFLPEEYREAMNEAGLVIQQEIKFFDSVINYFPLNAQDVDAKKHQYQKRNDFWPSRIINKVLSKKESDTWQSEAELTIPGRMYSYVCIKRNI
ncbi:MAG: class I SAM-dependent methyltransferase [Flavobacterium sp.]|nr:MAG: class I SAM-dependent methyltransferase [Flavobacterium sp.]